MKKETVRIIKTAVIIIVMAAAAIAYNVKWNDHTGVTELECAISGDNDAGTEDTTAVLPEAENTGKHAAEETSGQKPVTGTDGAGFDSMAGSVDTAGDKETGRIFIHVCGEVISPGVYELEEGSRIYEAIGMAGGFTEYAAADYLNMAQVLEDGMKIQVPNREEAAEWSSRENLYSGISVPALTEGYNTTGAPIQSAGSGTSKVNLNSATKEQLMTLKGIGESRAEAIIAHREEYGPFARIEDIMEVSGIKDAAFQKIKEDITV